MLFHHLFPPTVPLQSSHPQGFGHQLAWEFTSWIPQLTLRAPDEQNPWENGPVKGKLKVFLTV